VSLSPLGGQNVFSSLQRTLKQAILFIHSFIHSFIQVTGISISVDSTAALILAGPQNTAAISGQSTKLTCTSDRGTCDDVTWARTDQNDASIILHATGQMLEVQYR